MISTKNPFPGMNPFLERNWGSVHTKLISYMDDEISLRLPPGLVARPEERLAIDEPESGASYRTDVAVTEKWTQAAAPRWEPEATSGVTVAAPEIVRVDEEVHRWIEIRTEDGRVITVIELLSPANKNADYLHYKFKQRDYLQSHTSLVEIDLLRAGRLTLPLPDESLKKWPAGACYNICCTRSWRPGTREVYKWSLRERIPAFSIPLRSTDKDIALDLQPLIDRCYEIGRYHAERYDTDPDPPLPPDDAAWVTERLRAAGLRD